MGSLQYVAYHTADNAGNIEYEETRPIYVHTNADSYIAYMNRLTAPYKLMNSSTEILTELTYSNMWKRSGYGLICISFILLGLSSQIAAMPGGRGRPDQS